MDVDHFGHLGAVPCAVVLIPRGRDRDFTFSSEEGLEQVREPNRHHLQNDVDYVKMEPPHSRI